MSVCLTVPCSFSTVHYASAPWFAMRQQRQKNSEGEAMKRRVGGAQRPSRGTWVRGKRWECWVINCRQWRFINQRPGMPQALPRGGNRRSEWPLFSNTRNEIFLLGDRTQAWWDRKSEVKEGQHTLIYHCPSRQDRDRNGLWRSQQLDSDAASSGTVEPWSDRSLPITITRFTVDTVLRQRPNSKGALEWRKRGQTVRKHPHWPLSLLSVSWAELKRLCVNWPQT